MTTCEGTPNYTAAGLEVELREIKQTIKQLEEKFLHEISEVKALAEANRRQDDATERLRTEVASISTQVAANKSFSDKALGGLAVLMGIVAIAEVFLLFKPPAPAPSPALQAPITRVEIDPHGN